MTLKVFNKEVLFSDEEVKTFKDNKLNLSNEALEVILLSDNKHLIN